MKKAEKVSNLSMAQRNSSFIVNHIDDFGLYKEGEFTGTIVENMGEVDTSHHCMVKGSIYRI